MGYTKQLILHGGVILLVGLLCGAPLGSAVVRGKPEETIRAWRVAHSSLVMGGILLLALAGIVAQLHTIGAVGLLVGTIVLLWGAYAAL